jgi:uncharacterized protein (TIGR02246 family)
MSNDEQEIRELVARWMALTKAGDIQSVLSLMAEDVVFLRPGQPPMIGKGAFAAAAGAIPKQEHPQIEGMSEIQEIKVLGDWAFMWTKLNIVITPPDGTSPSTRAGHTLSILQKQHGKWVLARDANMVMPQ